MIADKQLTRMIEKGKPLSVIRKKVEALALAEDKRAFDVAIRDEYNELFPTKRQATEEELRERYEEFKTEVDNEVGTNPLDTYEKWVELAPDWTEIPESEQPDGYMQFPDWPNETRVIQEAVEATYDEDGMVLTEAVAEVTELVRPYVAKDATDRVDAYIRQATIPSVVTMRQARLSLLQSGLLATVEGAITNGTDEAMKIEWEYATDVRRDWASLIALTGTLGMTAEQLDNLFRLANSL